MKIKLLIFIGLAIVSVYARAAQVDTLANIDWTVALDNAIGAHERYVSVRESRIEELKWQLAQVDRQSMAFFRLNGELYSEYKSYVCDSALHYLTCNLHWAVQKEDREAADDTRIQRAHLMSAAGMYKEATEDLERVNRSELSARLLPDYYECYRLLYSELGMYTQDAEWRRHYYGLSGVYEDSLMRIVPSTSRLYLERKERRLATSGELTEALKVNDIRLESVHSDTPEYALITYHRSLIYHGLDDREEEKHCLALSALTDIRLAITDHASLWNLAQILYEEGDIERAYRYMRFSWDETNRYNARSRSLQTAGILSLIDHTYQAMQKKQNDRLRLYLWMISVLSLLLVGAVLWINHQRNKLAVARNKLEQANEQLQMSNHIKEEYIGRFLKLCSVYIDRLDAYRRMVNRKLSGGQAEELLKMVRSRDVLDTDLKELYDNFDTAFLHLFPDFVERFNELLQPDERITLRKGELLNTELRIFALIRLGIDDSSQIAEFLRYSVNTIYNYRAKVKNKACISREDFETRVMGIR